VHTLKGMFRNLSATSAQRAVESMQELNVECDSERIETAYERLQEQVESLGSELAGLSQQRVAGKAD